MGREIEKEALERKHEIIARIDIDNYNELNPETASRADVAVEFTVPSSVLKNIYKCFELDLPVVTGTTGWHENLEEVRKACQEGQHSLFHASNFSVGVNLFFVMNEYFTGVMNDFPQYDVGIRETHHIRKVDAPSGTAVSLAEIILSRLKRKNGWALDSKKEDDISIEAIREGDVTGIHSITWNSDIDYIEITHEAKNRKGFAEGAVLAAEYLFNKKGIFTMRDLLGI